MLLSLTFTIKMHTFSLFEGAFYSQKNFVPMDLTLVLAYFILIVLFIYALLFGSVFQRFSPN